MVEIKKKTVISFEMLHAWLGSDFRKLKFGCPLGVLGLDYLFMKWDDGWLNIE